MIEVLETWALQDMYNDLQTKIRKCRATLSNLTPEIMEEIRTGLTPQGRGLSGVQDEINDALDMLSQVEQELLRRGELPQLRQ